MLPGGLTSKKTTSSRHRRSSRNRHSRTPASNASRMPPPNLSTSVPSTSWTSRLPFFDRQNSQREVQSESRVREDRGDAHGGGVRRQLFRSHTTGRLSPSAHSPRSPSVPIPSARPTSSGDGTGHSWVRPDVRRDHSSRYSHSYGRTHTWHRDTREESEDERFHDVSNKGTTDDQGTRASVVEESDAGNTSSQHVDVSKGQNIDTSANGDGSVERSYERQSRSFFESYARSNKPTFGGSLRPQHEPMSQAMLRELNPRRGVAFGNGQPQKMTTEDELEEKLAQIPHSLPSHSHVSVTTKSSKERAPHWAGLDTDCVPSGSVTDTGNGPAFKQYVGSKTPQPKRSILRRLQSGARNLARSTSKASRAAGLAVGKVQRHGYPVHACIKKPDPELICTICGELAREAMGSTECKHIFCHGCILGRLLNPSSQSCPVDNTPLDPSQLQKREGIREKVDQTMVRCDGQSCRAVVSILELEIHRRDNCMARPQRCRYCGVSLPAGDMFNHMRSSAERHLELMVQKNQELIEQKVQSRKADQKREDDFRSMQQTVERMQERTAQLELELSEEQETVLRLQAVLDNLHQLYAEQVQENRDLREEFIELHDHRHLGPVSRRSQSQVLAYSDSRHVLPNSGVGTMDAWSRRSSIRSLGAGPSADISGMGFPSEPNPVVVQTAFGVTNPWSPHGTPVSPRSRSGSVKSSRSRSNSLHDTFVHGISPPHDDQVHSRPHDDRDTGRSPRAPSTSRRHRRQKSRARHHRDGDTSTTIHRRGRSRSRHSVKELESRRTYAQGKGRGTAERKHRRSKSAGALVHRRSVAKRKLYHARSRDQSPTLTDGLTQRTARDDADESPVQAVGVVSAPAVVSRRFRERQHMLPCGLASGGGEFRWSAAAGHPLIRLANDSYTVINDVGFAMKSVAGDVVWNGGRHVWSVSMQHCVSLSVGLVPASFCEWTSAGRIGVHSPGWMISTLSGKKYSRPPHGNTQSEQYCTGLSQSTVLGVVVDLSLGMMEFFKDGSSLGVAFTDIKAPVKPVVCLGMRGDSTTLMPFDPTGNKPIIS